VDATKWSFRQGFISAYTDNSGGFTVKGAPGEYLQFVISNLQAVRTIDDLKKMVPQRVTLKTTPQSEVEISAP
jgi:hypothetical protein